MPSGDDERNGGYGRDRVTLCGVIDVTSACTRRWGFGIPDAVSSVGVEGDDDDDEVTGEERADAEENNLSSGTKALYSCPGNTANRGKT